MKQNISVLPLELIEYIYSFNDMTKVNYNNCIKELTDTILQKKNYSKLLNHIKFLKYGPIYSLPRILKPNVKFYILINNFRLQ